MGVLSLRMSDQEEARIREATARSGLKISHVLRRAIERELRALGVEEVADEAAAARVRALELYAYLTRPDVKDRHRREFARAHPGARNAHLRPPEPARPKSLRFQLSLSVEEVLAIEGHGAPLKLRPAQFCTILVRRWLGLRKAPPASTANALGEIRSELRRIGVNINQIARAAHRSFQPDGTVAKDHGRFADDEMVRAIGSLAGLVQEIVGLVADVDVHLGRERRYWDIRTADTQDVDLHPSNAQPEEPL
jgi:hypothetical protein